MTENIQKWGWEIMTENVTLKDIIRKLQIRLEEAEKRARVNWDAMESVCCGEKLECPKCGENMPCSCDKGSSI